MAITKSRVFGNGIICFIGSLYVCENDQKVSESGRQKKAKDARAAWVPNGRQL
jgi:hypothetical protein